ncbi:MAG: 30S ribosome-binding factor RbfA [Candidatus Terrybacteria bacterium]|nr:30S ribosome-binding factor RbfA [Candidatus Terrybacteria bacterium]
MANPRRRARIGELLREEIAMLLLREELPEDAVVTVTRVTPAEDLNSAEVAVSVLPEDRGGEVIAWLQQRVALFQRDLNRRMRMRPVPRIRFLLDRTTAEADRIEAELYKLQQDH